MTKFVDTLVLVSIGVVGWFMRQLHAKVETTERDLSSYKTHVAENYVNKDVLRDIRNDVAECRAGIDDIKNILIGKKQ